MSHPPISAIGIDLGTTYSSVGIWRDGRVEIIANESGNYRTPSYVAFTDTERLIGDAAKNQAASNPTNTIFGAKRFMGRRFDDPNVEADRQHRNFVVAERNGKAMFQVEIGKVTKWFAPEEICAMVIGKLKESAEAYLGCQIDAGVIAVPAYFNDSQRQATKNAGSIAGLNVLKVVNEPSAVALAYGLDKDLKGTKKVLIFDLGGGVLDVSVLVVKEGSHFEVLSTAGDTHLGGDDFDDRIVDVIVEKFYSKHKIDLKGNSKAMRRLRVAAERAKKALSVATEVVIELDYLIENVDFRTTISRARFEHNCRDLFDRILQVVKTAVDRALIKIEDIDDVILAGGSSKIPKIQNILTSFLSNKKLNTAINGEEAVTYGAAIQAAIIAGNGNARLQEVLLTDVAPLSLGIETAGGIMTNVITCNTKIPCSQTRIFTTYADNQPAVKIQIFEGERLLTQDNNLLGTFDLTGLRLLPRGTPKIEVTFSLDVNGILTVSAIETSSKMMNNLTITNEKVGGLSQKDISRMRKDAEMYKETDGERKKCADSHNRMERYIFGLQRGIKDNSGRIAKQEKIILVEQSMKCLNMLEKRGFKNVEEYEEVYKELVANCEPIISKMEQKCVA